MGVGSVAKGLQTLQLPSNRLRSESPLRDLPRMSLGSRLICLFIRGTVFLLPLIPTPG
jgi:hypothetical protein